VRVEIQHVIRSLPSQERKRDDARIECHTVISFAASHRIASYHFVRRRIDDTKRLLSCSDVNLRAMDSYCGIPVSLSKCSVFIKVSVRTSTMASASRVHLKHIVCEMRRRTRCRPACCRRIFLITFIWRQIDHADVLSPRSTYTAFFNSGTYSTPSAPAYPE